MADKTVNLKEFRENMEEYIQEVSKGKSVMITKRSKPIFLLTPLEREGEFVDPKLLQWTDTFIEKHRPALERLARK